MKKLVLAPLAAAAALGLSACDSPAENKAEASAEVYEDKADALEEKADAMGPEDGAAAEAAADQAEDKADAIEDQADAGTMGTATTTTTTTEAAK